MHVCIIQNITIVLGDLCNNVGLLVYLLSGAMSLHSIGCCVSELHGHLCSYCNVWPEAIYTRTTPFTELFT